MKFPKTIDQIKMIKKTLPISVQFIWAYSNDISKEDAHILTNDLLNSGIMCKKVLRVKPGKFETDLEYTENILNYIENQELNGNRPTKKSIKNTSSGN